MFKRPTTLARHLRGFASPSTLQSSHFPSASYSSLPLNAWESGEEPKKRKEQPQKDRGNHLAVIPEIPQADGGGGDDRNNNNNDKNKGSCASCFGCIGCIGGGSGRKATTAQKQNAEANIGAQAEEGQGVGEYEEESWGISPEEEQLVEEYEEVTESGEWAWKQEDENDWAEEAVPLDTGESVEEKDEGEVWHEEPAGDWHDRNNEDNKGNKDDTGDGDWGGDGDVGDGGGLDILDGVGDLISL